MTASLIPTASDAGNDATFPEVVDALGFQARTLTVILDSPRRTKESCTTRTADLFGAMIEEEGQ